MPSFCFAGNPPGGMIDAEASATTKEAGMVKRRTEQEKFKLVVRMDSALAMRFKIACVRAGVSQQEAAAQAIRNWLRRERSEQ